MWFVCSWQNLNAANGWLNDDSLPIFLWTWRKKRDTFSRHHWYTFHNYPTKNKRTHLRIVTQYAIVKVRSHDSHLYHFFIATPSKSGFFAIVFFLFRANFFPLPAVWFDPFFVDSLSFIHADVIFEIGTI